MSRITLEKGQEPVRTAVRSDELLMPAGAVEIKFM
jgi:hypothetical protein